jgi:hypothetical protein
MVATGTRYHTGISRNTVLLAFTSLFADVSSENALSDSADLPNRLSICLDVGARHALQEM